MGVTCIQSCPFNENLIAVGSYDESVSIWDCRSTGRNALSEVKVGGGIWRIKWHPTNDNLLLAACMYSGFHLLNYNADSQQIGLKGQTFGFPQHETGKLAYGADWFRSNDKTKFTAALCSFYDSMCSCWSFDF